MFEILTVCTGNICRSPFAELVLKERLADLPGRVHSAGTMDLGARPMSRDAQRLAQLNGIAPEATAAHRSDVLLESALSGPDLIVVMTREHRRRVLELAPSRMRAVFTAREFARLAAATPVSEIEAELDRTGPAPSERLRAACSVLAAHRGMAPAPARSEDDDVIDPYRLPWETYQLMASQLMPALDEITRVVRLSQGGDRRDVGAAE